MAWTSSRPAKLSRMADVLTQSDGGDGDLTCASSPEELGEKKRDCYSYKCAPELRPCRQSGTSSRLNITSDHDEAIRYFTPIKIKTYFQKEPTIKHTQK